MVKFFFFSVPLSCLISPVSLHSLGRKYSDFHTERALICSFLWGLLLTHSHFLFQTVGLLEEVVTPRKDLPPLLLKLSERQAEHLDYLGVSYGLTPRLLK